MKQDIGKTAAALLGTASTVAATSVITGSAVIPAVAATVATAGLFALTSKLDSMPVNKKTAPVEPVSDTWKARPKANMVKWLMKDSGANLETVAEHLGCSVSYLNTKLARDSFSFEDLILVAYACGYTFVLVKNNEAIDYPAVHRVDLRSHFENSDPEVLERINAIEEKIQNEHRAEYEKKKAELERMKAEYGIED